MEGRARANPRLGSEYKNTVRKFARSVEDGSTVGTTTAHAGIPKAVTLLNHAMPYVSQVSNVWLCFWMVDALLRFYRMLGFANRIEPTRPTEARTGRCVCLGDVGVLDQVASMDKAGNDFTISHLHRPFAKHKLSSVEKEQKQFRLFLRNAHHPQQFWNTLEHKI